MAEIGRGMQFTISVETNKATYDYAGTSWFRLRRVLKELEIEGFAPAPSRSRRPGAASPDATARQRLVAIRTAMWSAFADLWRDVCGNFGDFEDDYREWKSAGEDADIDACELCAFRLYGALLADTLACGSEEELSILDCEAPAELAQIAIEWFREERAARKVPRD